MSNIPGVDPSLDPFHSEAGILTLSTSTSGDTNRIILRFNDLAAALPSSSTVISATLRLTFRYFTPGFTVTGQYIASNWSTASCCSGPYNGHIGWSFRDSQQSMWAGQGLSGPTDVRTEGGFSFDDFQGQTYAYTTKVVQLDTRVVQSWIGSPSRNNGVVLSISQAGYWADVVVGANALFPGTRPLLELVTVPFSVCAPPATTTGSTQYSSIPVDWYVDTVLGDDLAGSGVAPFPLASLNKAMQFAAPGDTVWLVGGKHPGGITISSPNITVRSAPNTRAAIASPRNTTESIVIHITSTASFTSLVDLDIAGSYHYGVLLDNVYGTRVGPTDVTISGCTIHDTGNTGIKALAGSDRLNITNNIVARTGSRIRTYGHGIDVLGSMDVIITDNFIDEVPNNGISVSGGSERALIARNLVNNTGDVGILLGWYEAVEDMGLSYDFAGTQQQLPQAIDCIVTDNIVLNAQGAGIGLYSAWSPIVSHNTLWFTAQSQMACLLINIVQVCVSWEYQPLTPCFNVTITNNIIVKSATSVAGPIVQIRSLEDATNPGTTVGALTGPLLMSDNVYSVLGILNGPLFEDDTPGAAFSGDLSVWQVGRGTDEGSVVASDVVLSSSFCPLACSPAAGSAPTPVLTDFSGAPVVGPPNIGAVSACGATSSKMSSLFAAAAGIPIAVPLPPPFSYPGFPDWAMSTFAGHACASLYVSPDGDDNAGDGSIASPWLTIARATSDDMTGPTAGALPCDTIYLRAGVYTEPVIIHQPNITLASFPGEQAYIVAPVDDPSIPAAVLVSTGGNGWNVPTEVTFLNLDVSGGYYYTLMFNSVGGGKSDFWDAYTAFSGVSARGYSLIQGCVLHGSGASVVKLSPDAGHITIRRSEIAHSGLNTPLQAGVGSGGARRVSTIVGGTDVHTGRRVSPRALDVWLGDDPYGSSSGGASPTAGGAVNDGPTTTNAQDSTLPPASNGHGIESRQGSFLTVEDSYIHDIAGVGILLGGGAQGCVIQRNILHDIGSIGVMVGSFDTEVEWMNVDINPGYYQALEAVVVNNVIADTGGAGVALYSTHTALIAHNTLLRVARSFHAGLLLNLSPELVSPWTVTVPTNVNLDILNNIVVVSRDGVDLGLEARIAVIPVSQLPPGPVVYTDPSDVTCSPTVDPDVGVRNADGSCPIFPADNPWHKIVSTLPTHPMSNVWMATICGCATFPVGCASCPNMHADFGSYGGSVYGIPFVTVSQGQPTVPVTITEYAAESDYPGPFPIPPNAPIEGLTNRTCPLTQCPGDRHVLVLDSSACVLYELYGAEVENGGSSWNAASTSVFHLTSNDRRPLGWTSADASGNSVFAGLVKYAEATSGVINHAIRMTVPVTQMAYVNDLASHFASVSTDPSLPPMGLRFRLKASYDCSPLSTVARAVCVALQTYGAVIMDNGSAGYLTGEANPAFIESDVLGVSSIPFSEMEAVLSGPLCTTAGCTGNGNANATTAIPAVLPTDFPSINIAGNVYHRDKFSYEPSSPLVFSNRDPENYVFGPLSQWQALTRGLGAPVDTSVESDPALDNLLNPSATLVQSLSSSLTTVPGVGTDFYGNIRSGMIVPGAIAFTPSSSSQTPNGWPSLASLQSNNGQCSNAPFPIVYVDPVLGSDISCTPNVISSPLATLAAALALVTPSGVITLRGGTYYTAGLSVSVPGITIVAYSGEIPVLSASISLDRGSPLTLLPAASGVTLNGLELVGGYDSGLFINGASHVSVIGCTIHGSGGVSVSVVNAVSVVIAGCTIRLSGQLDPPNGHGIQVSSSTSVNISSTLIDSARGYGIVVQDASVSPVVSGNTVMNCGAGIAFGPPSQPDPSSDSINCTPTPTNPSCHRVVGGSIQNNLILNVRGSGIQLAGTQGVTVLHNSLLRTALSLGSGIQFSALQLWNTVSNEGVMVLNVGTIVGNNLVVTAPLSAQAALSVTAQQPWSGGSSVGGIDWTTCTVSNNLFYKNSTAEPEAFVDLFYTLNANVGSPINSGFGSLSPSSSLPYVSDESVYPSFLTVSGWDALWGANNSVGDPALSSLYIPSRSSLAGPGSASPTLCARLNSNSVVTGQSDLLGVVRNCHSACVGAMEAEASPPVAPGFASLPLSLPAPASCMSPPTGPTACVPPSCYDPWQSNAPPAGLDYPTVYSNCLNGGAMFASDSLWSLPVLDLPVHPLSSQYVSSVGLGVGIHPDFGSNYGGEVMGMPTIVVNDEFLSQPLSFLYNTESDTVPYPIPLNSPMEGGECDSNGDRHLLVLNSDTCKLYEVYQLYRYSPQYWGVEGVAGWAQSGAVFSTHSNGIRPDTEGWTSADAAGLSVFAGLVHWYEVYGLGVINHAIRMTVSHPQRAYVSPLATHLVGSDTDPSKPPMGQRFRLKQSYDCAQHLSSQEARVVCIAMQTYGLIVADVGSNWFISGESHPGWMDGHVNEIKTIPSNMFEAVVTPGSQLCTDAGCQ